MLADFYIQHSANSAGVAAELAASWKIAKYADLLPASYARVVNFPEI